MILLNVDEGEFSENGKSDNEGRFVKQSNSQCSNFKIVGYKNQYPLVVDIIKRREQGYNFELLYLVSFIVRSH
ncbi:MAG: hypothetical protein LBL90_11545 [Prevotellaceae bacterium]|nr:hypothetical protein [Prevotellaceae bacterium]